MKGRKFYRGHRKIFRMLGGEFSVNPRYCYVLLGDKPIWCRDGNEFEICVRIGTAIFGCVKVGDNMNEEIDKLIVGVLLLGQLYNVKKFVTNEEGNMVEIRTCKRCPSMYFDYL